MSIDLKRAARLTDLARLMFEDGAQIPEQEQQGSQIRTLSNGQINFTVRYDAVTRTYAIVHDPTINYITFTGTLAV